MRMLIRTSTTFLVMALAAVLFGPSTVSAASADLDPFYGVVSQKKLSGKDFDQMAEGRIGLYRVCLLYTSPSTRDRTRPRMPSSA